MKIYIIGPTGSGKTTLANILSERFEIESYELDLLVFDDENGHIRRSDEEISVLFDDILKRESWIIEDVGRTKFKKGRELADKIYYIKLSRIRVYSRIFIRWIKQKLGLLKYNYPPNFSQLINMFKVANSYFRKENKKLKELSLYKNKVEFLNYKRLNQLEGNFN